MYHLKNRIMREVIFDIEGDSLEPTLIHCLSYCIVGTNEIKTIVEYSKMRDFFTDNFFSTFIGHNIINFDIPVLERILNFKLDKNKILIDTLGLSWYLYPNRKRHGLEVWGETLGVEKPKISDWKNLKLENYIFRCEQDVLINKLLFDIQIQYLKELYKEDRPKIISYLMFKLICAKEQVRLGWKLDVSFVTESLNKLIPLQQNKQESLAAIMPSVKEYKTVSPPKTLFKKDGSLSSKGVKWLELLKEKNLPSNFIQPITVLNKIVTPNPTSTAQIKNYLFSLGWKPTVYKYTVTKKGQNKVPQISTEGEICLGVKSLYNVQPALENLESLSIINHRINILKGFLRDKDEKNYLKARIAGFTNTLRFTHRELVNLPTIHKSFGKEIRGALTCESNEILCGSDMSSLEDKTKQHYMFFFDPKYVEELQTPGFDPHLDIAVLSEMLTPEQAQQHKDKIKDYSEIRKRAKQVNFSAVYGVGAKKMNLTTGMPIEQCQQLLKTYWERNKAVKKVAKSVQTKTVNDQMWLLNPISGFWYSLRFEKDVFSTLNQGSGVYCFDNFVKEVVKFGYNIIGQFHDEVIIRIPDTPEEKEKLKQSLNTAIEIVNNRLRLNVKLNISLDFGKTYADIH